MHASFTFWKIPFFFSSVKKTETEKISNTVYTESTIFIYYIIIILKHACIIQLLMEM